jgi:hypothetical protein
LLAVRLAQNFISRRKIAPERLSPQGSIDHPIYVLSANRTLTQRVAPHEKTCIVKIRQEAPFMATFTHITLQREFQADISALALFFGFMARVDRG